MQKKVFYSGVKALAEGAIFAGCRYYYGASRILNSEILNYLALRLPEVNGVFVNSENEHSAISMLIGSAAAGGRVLTTTTSDGITNMEEGLSYLCGLELPCVIGNIMSGRFGVRNYEPTQSGYVQTVRGSSASNHKFIVLAPSSVQEIYQLTIDAFSLADQYRSPVVILLDSGLAQLAEPITIETDLLLPDSLAEKKWKICGSEGRPAQTMKMYYPDENNKYQSIFAKFKLLEKETIAEEFMTEDAEEIIIAFGLMAKIAKGIVSKARSKGKKIGLFRPVSLSPFPKEQLNKISKRGKSLKVVEANTGALYIDVLNSLEAEQSNKISFIGESEELIGFRKIIAKLERELLD